MVALIIHLLVLATIYGILALSLNLVTGVTGLFNLGHAAFFGIGAYASAILTKLGVPWLLAVLVAILLAGLVAFIVGIPTLRLVGDYLAVVTMGLGEITRAVFKNWDAVTNGPVGLRDIPSASLFGFQFDTPEKRLVLGLVCLLLCYLLIERLLRSPFGRVLKSIREDEVAAQAMGKDVFRFKMWSLVIGSAMAGLAGSLLAHHVGFIDPSNFVMWLTFFIFLIIVLGGMGNNLGALVVTLIFVGLREGLRFVPSGALPAWVNPAALQQLLFGVLLVIATILIPRGLIPERKVRYGKR